MANLEKIVEDLSALTVLEAAELAKLLEEKWGVSAAAAVAVAAGPAGGAAAGRALRQKVRGAWLFAGLMLTYPTTYYFVFPHARYRHPIEPELLILAVFLISQTKKPARLVAADKRQA